MQMPFCAIMRSWTLLAAFGGSYAPGSTYTTQHCVVYWDCCGWFCVEFQSSRDKSMGAVQRRIMVLLNKRKHLSATIDLCLAETMQELVRQTNKHLTTTITNKQTSLSSSLPSLINLPVALKTLRLSLSPSLSLSVSLSLSLSLCLSLSVSLSLSLSLSVSLSLCLSLSVSLCPQSEMGPDAPDSTFASLLSFVTKKYRSAAREVEMVLKQCTGCVM